MGRKQRRISYYEEVQVLARRWWVAHQELVEAKRRLGAALEVREDVEKEVLQGYDLALLREKWAHDIFLEAMSDWRADKARAFGSF